MTMGENLRPGQLGSLVKLEQKPLAKCFPNHNPGFFKHTFLNQETLSSSVDRNYSSEFYKLTIFI